MKLYKYSKLSTRLISSIKNNEYYFSPFNKLNDPYELMMIGDRDAIGLIKFHISNPNDPFGIFCLTDSPTNTHMWTQYADGHMGVVIEFETDNDKSFFADLIQVEYHRLPPALNSRTTFRDLLKCKGIFSEKETEWRVIGKAGARKINPAAVTKIIIGFRAPVAHLKKCPMPELIETLGGGEIGEGRYAEFHDLNNLYWKNELPSHIDFCRTKIVYGSYELELDGPFVKTEITS